MRTTIGNQGEVRVDRIDAIPADAKTVALNPTHRGAHIISHSEQGHHHLLDGSVTLMERTSAVPAGMRILYAIVSEPTKLWQDATVPHGEIPLAEGVYELRIKREFDPFAEQARRVAD